MLMDARFRSRRYCQRRTVPPGVEIVHTGQSLPAPFLRESDVRPVTICSMNDWARLTKAELLERLRALELALPAATDKAAAELRDTNERLRAILETAVEGIITIDERGIIESFNRAAERIFGYSAAEVIGRNVDVLMPSPYRQEHDGYMANYRRTGHARIIGTGREVVGQRRDGSEFPMDLAVSEVRLADRRIFTGFVRDVSERKRLEREILEISDREQHRIGQDLHDGLCQQLAGIELMSQVLERKLAASSPTDAERVAELGGHVRAAIAQARQLAHGLSPVTLESEGLMSALQELANNSHKMFRVTCKFVCDPPVLVHDQTVATHLYRIAQEAVSNAIKHGKAQHVTLSLKNAGGRNVLMIKDDGVGLPKVLPKGKGMGLRIMQYRARMIGGAAMVERDLDGGTSVICSTPATHGKDGPAGT
ncbi:MAG: PAS domain S-box protein [Verrucomicrobiae bacterium]|nr:PAS domain S-box protein [Verrucomicrobiae bacterium]